MTDPPADADPESPPDGEETSDKELAGEEEPSEEGSPSSGEHGAGPTRTALGALRAMIGSPPEPPPKDSLDTTS